MNQIKYKYLINHTPINIWYEIKVKSRINLSYNYMWSGFDTIFSVTNLKRRYALDLEFNKNNEFTFISFFI